MRVFQCTLIGELAIVYGKNFIVIINFRVFVQFFCDQAMKITVLHLSLKAFIALNDYSVSQLSY